MMKAIFCVVYPVGIMYRWGLGSETLFQPEVDICYKQFWFEYQNVTGPPANLYGLKNVQMFIMILPFTLLINLLLDLIPNSQLVQ